MRGLWGGFEGLTDQEGCTCECLCSERAELCEFKVSLIYAESSRPIQLCETASGLSTPRAGEMV